MANEKRLIDANALKDAFLRYVRTQPHFHWGDWQNMCIHGTEIDEVIANAPTVDVAERKWIPVSERKPDLELVEAKDEDKDVYACLATIKHRFANGGRYVGKVYYDDGLFINEDCFDLTDDVTHWMPLPQPPKGE